METGVLIEYLEAMPRAGILLLALASGCANRNADPVPALAAHHQRFTGQMTGARFVGRFTTRGQEDAPAVKDEYEIKSVKKLEKGDAWLFEARIKYGRTDVTVPVPIDVIWAGDTPVITLKETTLPGLGTFSARIVIHGSSYAGTWSHGEVGGHMFGTIEKAP